MNKNKQTFIEKVDKIHKQKYSYEKFIFKSGNVKGIVTCPEHGDFQVTPYMHKFGRGCPTCGRNNAAKLRRTSKENFVTRSNYIHSFKYGYSKFIYINSHTSGIITCPDHGDFEQKPTNHLDGAGCPKCGRIKTINSIKLSLDELVSKWRQIHGYKHDYNKVILKDVSSKVTITCLKDDHGDFEITPSAYINSKHGCPKCANIAIGNALRSNSEDFIKNSKKIHYDRYGYDKVFYKNAREKVIVFCHVIGHGDFEVTPNNHLRGRGCPMCNTSKGEMTIKNILLKHKIQFVSQFRIPEVKEIFFYDFYIPEKNLLIEFHGDQHYRFIKYFHKTKEAFDLQLVRDHKKKALARAWGYKYLCIHHNVLERTTEDKFEALFLKSTKLPTVSKD